MYLGSILKLIVSAPVGGLYTFTLFYIMKDKNTNLGIKVNDVDACIGYANDAHFGNTGTCTAIVQLAAGDLVNLKVVDGRDGNGGVVHGNKYSGLSGFLLEP